METIPQPEQLVMLQTEIKESVRRHLKSASALSGKTIGQYLTDLLTQHGYEPPKEDAA